MGEVMSYDSPYTITMHFDLTDEDGRTAFEYARLGQSSHLALWELWDEMCRHQDDYHGLDQITHQWLQRLNEIMRELEVPLEV